LTFASLALALVGCGQNGSATAPQSVQAENQTPAPSSEPVEQGPPNNADAQPAFPEQTRAPASPSNVSLAVETVAEGIEEPWAAAVLPRDGALLVTARTGKLWLIEPGAEKREVSGAPEVDAREQGGLLDISLGPDFMTARTVYLTFSEPRGDGKNSTSLARATLSEDRTRLENVTTIFRQEPAWASNLHFGSNLEWDSAGNLYLTLGERSLPEPRQLAQDLSTHIGKVVRLKADGTPADGNPFLGQADVRPEIWSYGHRNVQGAAIHPDTGELWVIEHGPRGGDEINIAEAGKNYGWPVICYCIDYSGAPIAEATAREGMEQPVYYWDPVIAPGDMIFYGGNLLPWKGDILASSLKPGALVRLEIEDERVVGEERLLTDQGRIRDIAEAPDGALYVLTDETDGKVLRVTPQG